MKYARAASFLLLISGLALQARDAAWFDAVAPVMTAAEKKVYLSLQPEAQLRFRENFWTEKSITAEEYYRRLQYIDSNYGSTKTGSGANTDPGRVYLSLGPPDRMTRIPSSRIFAPLEIWYYNTVPALHLNTELRLIFYQKNSLGLPKLYSPTLDTIRALLLPQSSTISMFGPNDDLTESDIRKNLTVGPAEDEVISAAVGVATGIKTTGTDELLGRVASPEFILRKPQQTDVESRFFVYRPRLEMLQTASSYGGRQIDFVLSATTSRQIDMQVLDGTVTVYQNRLRLKFQHPEALQYLHRLDLLPGSYTVIFSLDGKPFPYPLTIPTQISLGGILRANEDTDTSRADKPLLFGGRAFTLSDSGQTALVDVPAPGDVTWTVRKGMQVLSKSSSTASTLASFDLPSHLAPAVYSLEATYGNESRTIDFTVGKIPDAPDKATLLSFNANLQPALRWSFIGHQYLLKNNLSAARRCLEESLKLGVTKEVEVELARAEALAGEWDAARNRVSRVLASRPADFDALTVLAYIETKLQDYAVAAELYRRALAVQDSPALRTALAKLPQASVAN